MGSFVICFITFILLFIHFWAVWPNVALFATMMAGCFLLPVILFATSTLCKYSILDIKCSCLGLPTFVLIQQLEGLNDQLWVSIYHSCIVVFKVLKQPTIVPLVALHQKHCHAIYFMCPFCGSLHLVTTEACLHGHVSIQLFHCDIPDGIVMELPLI